MAVGEAPHAELLVLPRRDQAALDEYIGEVGTTGIKVLGAEDKEGHVVGGSHQAHVQAAPESALQSCRRPTADTVNCGHPA